MRRNRRHRANTSFQSPAAFCRYSFAVDTRSVLAIEHPAPVGNVRQQNPCRRPSAPLRCATWCRRSPRHPCIRTRPRYRQNSSHHRRMRICFRSSRAPHDLLRALLLQAEILEVRRQMRHPVGKPDAAAPVDGVLEIAAPDQSTRRRLALPAMCATGPHSQDRCANSSGRPEWCRSRLQCQRQLINGQWQSKGGNGPPVEISAETPSRLSECQPAAPALAE